MMGSDDKIVTSRSRISEKGPWLPDVLRAGVIATPYKRVNARVAHFCPGLRCHLGECVCRNEGIAPEFWIRTLNKPQNTVILLALKTSCALSKLLATVSSFRAYSSFLYSSSETHPSSFFPPTQTLPPQKPYQTPKH